MSFPRIRSQRSKPLKECADQLVTIGDRDFPISQKQDNRRMIF
jgi:hypothetical protein